MHCDDCVYYAYDEEDEEWYCTADMDEDDLARMMEGRYQGCPFYRSGDDYAIVRLQM